ncbi:MAG: hypothetical protein ABFD84_05150 [Candidatus Polarisedimenticolia bacterium]
MAKRATVAGSRFYIGGTPLDVPDADLVEADFASYSWTEVKGWATLGAVGDTAASIAVSEINRARDFTLKGTRNGGTQEHTFNVIPSDAGQIALLAAQATAYNYPFKIVLPDAPAPRSSTVTMTVAAPGVVTWTAHGLSVDTPVVFTTTGALPTGLTAGTTYYVKAVPTADTFTVSATVGGSAITTSGTQSGTHTVTTAPTGSERKFVGVVMATPEQGGEANTVQAMGCTIAINSNIVRKAALG